MYSKILIVIALSLVIAAPGFTQQKSKKELKEEARIEKQKQTEVMINAREFVFIGRLALPQGMRTVDLTTHQNYIKFHPDLVESYMPYYGQAFTSPGYGNDVGLKFEGKPEKCTVNKEKKNYQVSVEVKAGGDYYKLALTVGFEGDATLVIMSNNRATISYNGSIS